MKSSHNQHYTKYSYSRHGEARQGLAGLGGAGQGGARQGKEFGRTLNCHLNKMKEDKRKIYELRNGEVWLSEGCPCCSKNKIKGEKIQFEKGEMIIFDEANHVKLQGGKCEE